ncbi:MAG: hypothetical protein HY532_00950 [Chloroflexi bacterium]|nr:hypothetical protein [Chloroflexota bacterium]
MARKANITRLLGRFGAHPSYSSEWGWAAGRLLAGAGALLGTLYLPQTDGLRAAVVLLSLAFLGYNLFIGALLWRRWLLPAFLASLVMDNLFITSGWWYAASLVPSVAGLSAESDLYLVLFPLAILGGARLGWLLGSLQIALWVGVMSAATWVYYDHDSYSFIQLPIRVLFLAVTSVLVLNLLSRLDRERQRALKGEAQLAGALEHLKASQRAMSQSERLAALGKMASGIVHDVRNTVTPIIGFSQLVLTREKQLSQEARDYLQLIYQAGEDINRMAERLSDFYRPRVNSSPFAPVNLNTVTREVIALTQPRWREVARSAGVDLQVETDLAPGAPVILGNASELREALANLIFNATEAIAKKGVIRVRTRLVPAPSLNGNSTALLEVIDNGIGMDEETLLHCLEPFYTTKGEKGTGMGLAMVFGTAQRHGGRLEVESQPGKGATVRLVFPISHPEQP